MRCKYREVVLTARKIDSDWTDISDTNLGPFNYEELFEEIFIEEQVTPRIERIVQSGLANVALFPLFVQCLELILAAVGAYNPATR